MNHLNCFSQLKISPEVFNVTWIIFSFVKHLLDSHSFISN